MRIPAIRGAIDRRILTNFRIDPDVMAKVLPPPFRPKCVNGYAIGGICLIRLKSIRPILISFPCGLGSENAAHRIAVEWDVDGQSQEGVYVPRRDTSSRMSTLVGGRIFPSIQHHAEFTVKETGDHLSVALQSDDGTTRVCVSGKVTDQLPSSSVFSSLGEASEFFEKGSLGYSVSQSGNRYDGLELRCKNWRVEAFEVDEVQSDYFEDETLFPPGSLDFDCALLMRDIQHEWHVGEDLLSQ